MCGECNMCGEHALECKCEPLFRCQENGLDLDVKVKESLFEVAISALNLSLHNFSLLGYELPEKFEIKKKEMNNAQTSN